MNILNLIDDGPHFGVLPYPSLPEDPLEGFTLLLDFQRKTLREEMNRLDEEFCAAREQAFKDAWIETMGKKKFNHDKAIDAFPGLQTTWEQTAHVVLAQFQELREKVKEGLFELAESITPAAGNDWTLAETFWDSTYGSQGFAARAYAKGRADIRNLDFICQGLEAEVRRKESDWEVWVKASKVNIEIANRRPSLSIVEFVAACWKKGLNPRVYQPLLPPEFEDQHGMDYHGNIRGKS